MSAIALISFTREDPYNSDLDLHFIHDGFEKEVTTKNKIGRYAVFETFQWSNNAKGIECLSLLLQGKTST